MPDATVNAVLTAARAILVFLSVTAGLFVIVAGGFTATNRHGFADWYFAQVQASVRWLTRVPPWRWLPGTAELGRGQRWWMRLTGGLFALLGPVVMVGGTYTALTADIREASPQQLESHPVLALAALAMIVVGTAWAAKSSALRSAWRSGRFARWVLLVGYGGTIGFAVGIAVASPIPIVIGWSVAALAVVVFIVAGLWRH